MNPFLSRVPLTYLGWLPLKRLKIADTHKDAASALEKVIFFEAWKGVDFPQNPVEKYILFYKIRLLDT